MKLRLPYVIISVVILALLFSACAGSNQRQPEVSPDPAQTQQPETTPEPASTPEATDDTQDTENKTPDNKNEVSAELRALLPEREDYEWVYNGFAEYGHELELEEIEHKNGRVVYEIEGEVFDMSGGESDDDYSLSVDFIVTSDSLIQEKKGEKMMDLFDSMVLIQLPLEEENTWTQTVKGEGGEEIQLECTIEKIEDKDGAKAYTVLYQDKNSPYYEKRVITEGVGVTEFTRLYIQEGEDEDFEVSYWLYEEASGYND